VRDNPNMSWVIKIEIKTIEQVKRDNINMTIIVYLPLVLRILVITRIFHQEVRLNNQIMTKLS